MLILKLDLIKNNASHTFLREVGYGTVNRNYFNFYSGLVDVDEILGHLYDEDTHPERGEYLRGICHQHIFKNRRDMKSAYIGRSKEKKFGTYLRIKGI
ncbi:hypothetical protein SAMN04487969_105116 [Paenibacillus algorifonticola]|uniref:Uncharacterized protein n=1 Tax=Paenibacillus algorifonticola TaxID=684063 RepID=A0A1I2CJV1_9BACL|nr:hypothetical protein [Paenibacillus algorifonticola]SFE68581.1 hypothetical protein SAMN04487969_105116 [Paenibacillus algorifonticola]